MGCPQWHCVALLDRSDQAGVQHRRQGRLGLSRVLVSLLGGLVLATIVYFEGGQCAHRLRLVHDGVVPAVVPRDRRLVGAEVRAKPFEVELSFPLRVLKLVLFRFRGLLKDLTAAALQEMSLAETFIFCRQFLLMLGRKDLR